MRVRLLPTETVGRIAVANLAAVGLLPTAWLVAFPDGVEVDSTSKAMLTFDSVLEIMLGILIFPVGWVALLVTPMDSEPFTAVLFVPLNAYLWGGVVAAIENQLRRSKKTGQVQHWGKKAKTNAESPIKASDQRP